MSYALLSVLSQNLKTVAETVEMLNRAKLPAIIAYAHN